MSEVNNPTNQIKKPANNTNKVKLDNYHLQIALDFLFNNKDASKEDFIKFSSTMIK